MNILFCASEAAPFAASGGLGDVAGSLPKAVQGSGAACRVVLPLYEMCIRDRYVPAGSAAVEDENGNFIICLLYTSRCV